MTKFLASITFESVCEFDNPNDAAQYLAEVIEGYDWADLWLSIDVEKIEEGDAHWLTEPENVEEVIGG